MLGKITCYRLLTRFRKQCGCFQFCISNAANAKINARNVANSNDDGTNNWPYCVSALIKRAMQREQCIELSSLKFVLQVLTEIFTRGCKVCNTFGKATMPVSRAILIFKSANALLATNVARFNDCAVAVTV